jgi:hypothetical protein
MINIKESRSPVLGLEVLKKQYETVLIQYNQAQTDYIDYLNSNLSENEVNKNYRVIKGKTFWGTSGISEQSSESIEDCKLQCSNDSKCTGATFNQDKNYCWIRTGDGTITDGLQNDYAIIPEEASHIKVLHGLSEKLAAINDKMLKMIENESPVYEDEILQRREQIRILSNSYNKLITERNAIKTKLRNYEDLNAAESDGETNILKHRSIYIFSIVGLFLLIILFFRLIPGSPTPPMRGGGGGGAGNYTVMFVLFLVLILVSLFIEFK